jgi:hypothetical protein
MHELIRLGRALPIVLLPLLAVLGPLGCATTVVPPRDVHSPATVYLADYGRHSSVALPHADGEFVEYTYGEWRWFALNDTGFFEAFRALGWPSQGALGRRVLVKRPANAEQGDSANGRTEWRSQAPDGGGEAPWPEPGVTLFELMVERAAAAALAAELEARWKANESQAVFNPLYGLHFVPDESRYHVFGNCNPETARWLRELGCQTRGPALLSAWRLQPQPE